MKIVGFETAEGRRLGVIENDQVIDIQAVDEKAPADLGEWLRRGDLAPLRELAQRAPAAARRPLAGLKFAMPVSRNSSRSSSAWARRWCRTCTR
jgi:hypothetical protein